MSEDDLLSFSGLARSALGVEDKQVKFVERTPRRNSRSLEVIPPRRKSQEGEKPQREGEPSPLEEGKQQEQQEGPKQEDQKKEEGKKQEPKEADAKNESRKQLASRSPTSVAIGVKASKSSDRAFDWVLADPLGFGVVNVVLIHVSKKKERERGEVLMKAFADRVKPYGKKFVVETKWLELDRHGVGHTIKAWLRDDGPHMFVAGYGHKELNEYFATADTWCPVVLVKSEMHPAPDKDLRYENVAIAQSSNKHSEHGFAWLLERMKISKDSQLVVCHVVLEKEDKPKAREFLASFKPRCEGKHFIIRSALIYAKKERTTHGGLKSFCEMKDKPVGLMVISPRPAEHGKSKTRVGGGTTLASIDILPCDLLYFKDERTQAADLEQGYVSSRRSSLRRTSSTWLNVNDMHHQQLS